MKAHRKPATLETSEKMLAPIDADVPCLRCGYNLRGLTGNVCPECGASIERARTGESFLPWVRRSELGHVRAFWATVFVVVFRPRYLWAEIARPVSYRDAQAFRWRALVWTSPAILVLMWSWYLPWVEYGDRIEWLNALFVRVWPVVAFPVLLFVLMAAGTGLPSYFFHPRDESLDRQNRAVALSYYTSAFLPLLNVPGLVAVIGLWLTDETEFGGGMIYLANLLIAAVLLVWIGYLGDLLRKAFPERTARAVAMGTTLPLLWIATIAAIMVGIPSAILFVIVMVESMV